MLNKNAKKWVKALRSGKFKQTQAYLSENGKFCCLGVACELAIKDGVKIFRKNGSDCILYGKRASSLPKKVIKWLHLSDALGTYVHQVASLASDNDSGKTFEQIAKIIESEPKGLFND